MAYKSRLMEIGGVLYLEIPSQVQEQIGIDPAGRVGIKIYDRKSFLVEVNVAAEPARENCQACLQRAGNYTCQLCKRFVCTSCYWEMGGICRECMGK